MLTYITMDISLCPPEWYQSAKFRVLAHALIKLGVFQLPQLTIQFCRHVVNQCATKSHFLPVLRVTWAELHENKRTDWLTRNSLCDHRIKIRSRGNLCDFPHEPSSRRVRGRLWYKRIHTNCLYGIEGLQNVMVAHI